MPVEMPQAGKTFKVVDGLANGRHHEQAGTIRVCSPISRPIQLQHCFHASRLRILMFRATHFPAVDFERIITLPTNRTLPERVTMSERMFSFSGHQPGFP